MKLFLDQALILGLGLGFNYIFLKNSSFSVFDPFLYTNYNGEILLLKSANSAVSFLRRRSYSGLRFAVEDEVTLSIMDSPPSKSYSLCDRFVTGNSDLDNWIWIIQYFAKFKTEISMLHDVFEMVPNNLPDYLGEHTNEMVAFRCLASLQSKNVVTDTNKSKIEFDSSESCEYVLQCILDEVPLSELKPGAPGLSKWNLVPFLRSKLVSLPKCALELMLETSCENDTQVSPCKEQETNQSESEGHVSIPSENRYKCIQCKESGKLLFCSGDECTVMVHEKCIADSSPPVYDDSGNFYCSLCAITSVSAEYLQSQEEVAKAKKKLISFLSLMSKINKKKKPLVI